MRRALLLLAVALAAAGCGSTPPAELPPPAVPVASPPLDEPPAGRVVPGAPDPAGAEHAARVRGRTIRSDRERGVLLVDGRAVRVPGLLAPDGVTDAGEGQVAVVDAKRRRLVLVDARTLQITASAPAGVGPTHVEWDGRDRFYVADTAGGALLVFERRGRELVPTRYVHLPGSPYAMDIDTRTAYRVWVALTGTNELVGLPAHGRPRVVERLPTVRAPQAVTADPATGRVVVTGTEASQVLTDPAGR